jgi:hypothetical protein
MASNYPGSYDTLSNPTAATKMNAVGVEHDILHAQVNDAVEAIQQTLGTSPQGPSATVAQRLSGLQAKAERGQPGGYAALDASGRVLDGSGAPVSLTGSRVSVQDETDAPFTPRSVLTFVGDGVSVTDDPSEDRVVVSVTGTGPGSTPGNYLPMPAPSNTYASLAAADAAGAQVGDFVWVIPS